jgi:NAD(P)-dependent dehydrogenase (short-subunit alcohol dehydrogenase family)
LAAGAIVAPSLLGGAAADGKTKDKSRDVDIAPNYYPLKHFRPEIDLEGKLAVITGASRGIGRAVGEALAALGVDVIGTSRNPAGVPDPPAFPLLALDVADPASVLAFVGALLAHTTFQQHGHVDILANNAGRMVAGRIVPLSPSLFADYLQQRALGMSTLYFGHVTVTNAVLPLMPQQGYSRILFTASIDAYTSFAQHPLGSLMDVYPSAKVALRYYANNLDMALHQAGSSIRVSTVNPYVVKTALLEHPNPIYTQPVNGAGLSDTDPMFNQGITLLRQLLANGLPASMVGEAFVQLLTMEDPDQNVVVASPREPLATQGANAIIEDEILAENQVSAVPFTR